MEIGGDYFRIRSCVDNIQPLFTHQAPISSPLLITGLQIKGRRPGLYNYHTTGKLDNNGRSGRKG